MKIKELCNNIIELYEDTENQDRRKALHLVYTLRFAIESPSFSNDDLIPILETAKKIALTKGNFKQKLEKELLSIISCLPDELWMLIEDESCQKIERNTKSEDGQIAESLVRFAKEIYEIKLDRDTFAGKRRGYALQILESLSHHFDVPEFMELCSKSIKSKSKNEFLDSVECLKEYCKERDETPSDAIIEAINKRIEKTKNRVEATSGLNLQVEIGLISELEALSRLDAWKEKMEDDEMYF